MRKGILALFLPYLLCLVFILGTGWLLLNPVRVLAASCTAKCATGSVTCEGTDCEATDGVGCNSNGGTIKIYCSGSGSIGGGRDPLLEP